MPVLAVHGYEIYANGSLSKLCESTCQRVAANHGRYETIILLAGMHLHGAPETVDRAMGRRLIELGVPSEKLFLWSELCPQQRPPRDTMEEVDLLPIIFRDMGLPPREVIFDVACVWYFRWRIGFLYRHRGAKVNSILGAPSLDPKRMAIEAIAWLATRKAPDGKLAIIEKNRAGRNVFPIQPNGRLWYDNVPSNWG